MPISNRFQRFHSSGPPRKSVVAPRKRKTALGISQAARLTCTTSLTNFNVAISVISLFFLLAKLIAFIMKLWFPLVSTLVNVALLALYTVSVYGQIGPDYADPRYPAPAAWYFRQGCGLAKRYGAYSACQIAQGSLAATFYMQ